MINFADSMAFKRLIFYLNRGNDSDYGCVEINSVPAKDDFIEQLEEHCEKEVVEIDFSPFSKVGNKKNTELIVKTHQYLTIKNFSEKYGEDKIFVFTNLHQSIDEGDEEAVRNLVVEINMNRENYVRYPSTVLFIFPKPFMDKIFLIAADFISMMVFHFDFTGIEREALKKESPRKFIELKSNLKVPTLSLKESYIENFHNEAYPLLERLESAFKYIEVCNYFYLFEENERENIEDIVEFVQALELTTEKRVEICLKIYSKVVIYEAEIGNYAKALEYNKKAIEISEKVYGKEHPYIGVSYNDIANVYSEMGEYEKALEYYRKAIEITEKVYGREHPDIGVSYNDIAVVYRKLGEYEKALKYNEKAIEISEKVNGKEHPDTGRSYNNIAGVYQCLGEHEKALEYNEKAIKISEKVYGKEHPDIGVSYNDIAVVYRKLGEYEKALKYNEKAIEISEKVYGKEHPDTGTSYNNIALVYKDLSEYEKALEYYKKALNIYLIIMGKEHPDTKIILNNLLFCYEKSGRNVAEFDAWLKNRL